MTGKQVQPISDERLAEIEMVPGIFGSPPDCNHACQHGDCACSGIRPVLAWAGLTPDDFAALAARMRAAEAEVERLRAKVARVEALAGEWDNWQPCNSRRTGRPVAEDRADLRAALADEEGDRD